jgi:hypothetical protein
MAQINDVGNRCRRQSKWARAQQCLGNRGDRTTVHVSPVSDKTGKHLESLLSICFDKPVDIE